MMGSQDRRARRFFRLFRRKGWAEEEVDLEIRHHLEARVDELLEQGYRPEEARRLAEDALGDWPRYRSECVTIQKRRERKMRWMDGVASGVGDVVYGLRGIRRNPGFAAAVILTLALGIGANTAIFTVVDAVMLHPIPYEDPDELFELGTHFPEENFGLFFFPWEGARRWLEAGPFPELAPHGRVRAVRTDGAEPENVTIQAAGSELFSVLRTGPLLGRSLLPEDERLTSPDVVLLGYAFWEDRLGGDRGVLGETLVLDRMPFTVIGVLPPQFRFPFGTTDLYVALREDGTALGRSVDQVQLVGRIPTDVERGVFEERLGVFADGIQELGPSRGAWEPRLLAMNDPSVQAEVGRAMWIVFGAVGLMLFIAILNGINLLLARGTARSREIGVRIALGASRARVVRQLLLESLILAFLSGGAAVFIATGGVEALMSVAPRDLTWADRVPVSLSGRVLGFTFVVTVLTGLAFGLIPALRAVRTAGATPGAAMSVYEAGSRGSRRLRGSLVVAQVALSLTLLFGATLLGRSFARLVGVDPGFSPEGLSFLEVNLGRGRYPTNEEVHAFGSSLRDRVRGIPGVQSVSLSVGTPPSTGITFGDRLEAEDRVGDFEAGDWIIAYASVDTAYISTMGIRLVAGRPFQAGDLAGGHRPVIIDRDLALHLWGTANAAGNRFRLSEGEWSEVVGVVEDLKLTGLEDRYTSFAMLRPLATQETRGFLSLNIRSDLEPGVLFPLLRAASGALDPNLPVYQTSTAADALWDSLARPRFFLLLMGVFATVAVVLAGVGVYGVLSFTVSQRSREMGIRAALGAGMGSVRALVLRGGLKLAGSGMALGVAISWWAALVLEGLLFQTTPRDLVAFGVVVTMMLGVSVLASLVPARRATRVDLVQVLKAEG